MATRPVFLPLASGAGLVREEPIDFEWVHGMALSQARRSIANLHAAAASRLGVRAPLEVSSKSMTALGVSLSAFNLRVTRPDGREMSVESAYQGSKVFSRGGPYHDLYDRTALDAKRDERIRASGDIVAFDYCGERWPTTPKSAFYDWLYVRALAESPSLAAGASSHDGFTDISFNPKKSFNCQARSVAAFVALQARGELRRAILSRHEFLSAIRRTPILGSSDPGLFG